MIFIKCAVFFTNSLKISPISIGCGNFFRKLGKILTSYSEF